LLPLLRFSFTRGRVDALRGILGGIETETSDCEVRV
jgi:hypothetical protein